MSATQQIDLWKLFNENYSVLPNFIEKEVEIIDNKNSANETDTHSHIYYHLCLVSKGILSAIKGKIENDSPKERDITVSKTIKNAEIDPIIPIFKKMGINLQNHHKWHADVIVTITNDFAGFIKKRDS